MFKNNSSASLVQPSPSHILSFSRGSYLPLGLFWFIIVLDKKRDALMLFVFSFYKKKEYKNAWNITDHLKKKGKLCGNFWQYYAEESDSYVEKMPDYAEISKINKVVPWLYMLTSYREFLHDMFYLLLPFVDRYFFVQCRSWCVRPPWFSTRQTDILLHVFVNV